MSPPQTIMLGDLSGLQDFLFDVASVGGGQARRLRARSLFIALLAEAAALRMLEAVGWSRAQLVFSAAGKFLLVGPGLNKAARNEGDRVVGEMSRWLFTQTGAALRLAVSIVDTSTKGSLLDAYNQAQRALQRAKWQPWRDRFAGESAWPAAGLVLSPISPPCDLCGRRVARQTERDAEGAERRLCDRCFHDGELGRLLPTARWLEFHAGSASDTSDLIGFTLRVTGEHRPSAQARHVFALSERYPLSDSRIIRRHLARHVPSHADGQPIEFKDLAARAEGTPLLGVLKLDADNLGEACRSAVQGAPDFTALKRLSERLDDFFARRVDDLLEREPWSSLYMVFSGGDDLLVVGPWNIAFDFAGQARQAFAQAFASDGLTLSGGLALIKPTFPIRSAADQADSLLDEAKSKPAACAPSPKDQFAAFGQVWKWREHAAVVGTAGRLASWVRQGVMPRGWLHTMLDLAEARNRSDASPVTARLAYHIGRNYPSGRTEGAKGELRRWADALLSDFDAGTHPETRQLPAILRHALTATRSRSQVEP